jgi:mono/diheme cytochrome c family protein
MIKRFLLGLALFSLMLVAFIWWRTEGSETMEPGRPVSDKATQIDRGRYLAQAGDCLACHTSRGGTAYAGGRAIATAFGMLAPM